MILKLSIFGLVLVLIAVIAIQYYRATEAFQNAKHRRKQKTETNSSDACANVSDSTPIAEIPLECAQQSWLNMGCTKDGSEYPANRNVKMYTNPDAKTETYGSLKERRKIAKNDIANKHPGYFSNSEFMKDCFGTSPSAIPVPPACEGIADDTPIKDIPLACAQEFWLDSGCTTKGDDYPTSLDSKFYKEDELNTFEKIKMTMSGVKYINRVKDPSGEDPEFKRSCFGTSPSMPAACEGISDDTPIENVPLKCAQQLWLDTGCTTNGIEYPLNLNSDYYTHLKGETLGGVKIAMRGMKMINTNKMPEGEDPTYKTGCFGSSVPDRSAAAPERKDIQPQISVSDTSYMAMKGKQKSDLLSSIQKIVRNELLANRVTQPTVRNIQDNDDYDTNTNDDSHCTAQGSEFKKATPKRMSKGCPDSSDPCDISDQPQNSAPKPYKSNMPDMSKYIKKDSIPCWGCSLDY